MNVRRKGLSSLLVVSLASCGGGGGGGTPPPPVNSAPSLQVPSGVAGVGPRYSFALATAAAQSLQFEATDPEGDSLQWVISADAVAAAAAGISYSSPVAGGTFVLTLSGVSAPVAVNLTMLVEDPRGAAAAIDVLVVRSGAPTITGVTPSSAFAGKPQQVEVTGTALRLGGAVNTNVRFGGILATGVQIDSETKVRCTTPVSGALGPTVVGVEHAYGSAALPGTSFTMFAYPPTFAAADQRLDATVATAADLAIDDRLAHAVWLETGAVHHRRSTDGGLSWLPAVAVSGAEVASEPHVLVLGSDVLVAWVGDGQNVWIARSTDDGLTFLPPQRIDGTAPSVVPISDLRLCQTGDRRHAAWIAGARVWATTSIDRGAVWSTAAAVDDVGAAQSEPLLAAEGAIVWLACLDERLGSGSRGVYVTRSVNGGAWASMLRLSPQGVAATEPCLTSLGSRVHAAWVQAGVLFYAGSLDNGVTWPSASTQVRDGSGGILSAPRICATPDQVLFCYLQSGLAVWVSRLNGNGGAATHVQIDNDAAADAQPQLGCVGSYVFAAWRQGAVGDGSARVRHVASTDGGATFTASAGLGDGTAAQDQPRLVHDGARLLLGWLDSRDPAVGLFVNRSAQ